MPLFLQIWKDLVCSILTKDKLAFVCNEDTQVFALFFLKSDLAVAGYFTTFTHQMNREVTIHSIKLYCQF